MYELNQRLLDIIYCVNKNIRSHNVLKTSAHDGVARGAVFIILMTGDGTAIEIVLLLDTNNKSVFPANI